MILKNGSTKLSFETLHMWQPKISVYQPKGTGKILDKNKF